MKSKKAILFGVLIILFVVMVLMGTINGFVNVMLAYKEVFSPDLTFKQILTFDFPESTSTTGVFSLFFGYWAFELFGEYFYMVVLLFLFFCGILLILRKPRLLLKTLFLFFAVFIVYTIVGQLGFISETIGIVPRFSSKVLDASLIRLFGRYFYLVFVLFLVFEILGFTLKIRTFKIKPLILFGSMLFLNLFIHQLRSFGGQVGFVQTFFITKAETIFGRNLSIFLNLSLSFLFLLLFLTLKKISLFFQRIYNTIIAFKSRVFSVFKPSLRVKNLKPSIKTNQGKSVDYIQELEDELFAQEDIDIQVENKVGKKKQSRGSKLRKRLSKTSNKTKDPNVYTLPKIDEFLLTRISSSGQHKQEELENISRVSQILQDKLLEFGVEAKVVKVSTGPIITQYELEPSPGIKVSRFANLQDDLALAIKARSIRILAPIPGKGRIGIELPNRFRDTIYLKDVIGNNKRFLKDYRLPIALGKDTVGNPVIEDLVKMPHLLIAGATGSGKSVCVNTIINTLLFHSKPENVRMVMIDPKRIELAGYKGIPHLIHDVVTSSDEALKALNWAVYEMEQRYKLLQKYGVKDILSYNQKVSKSKQSTDGRKDEKLPYIVLIVDEFADLIMTAGRDIEMPITRLAQMARAIGIHLILATQRPSTKIITGIIKANFPSRIAFQVSSKIDSRVILDTNGAEKLLGRGDMLLLATGKSLPVRIHGAYISEDEIENLMEYLSHQPKPALQIEIFSSESTEIRPYEYDDELFPQAASFVVSSQVASVSMLQRHFKIGYARAGRLVDMLEEARFIGPHLGSKSRDVLATEEDLKVFGYDEQNS